MLIRALCNNCFSAFLSWKFAHSYFFESNSNLTFGYSKKCFKVALFGQPKFRNIKQLSSIIISNCKFLVEFSNRFRKWFALLEKSCISRRLLWCSNALTAVPQPVQIYFSAVFYKRPKALKLIMLLLEWISISTSNHGGKSKSGVLVFLLVMDVHGEKYRCLQLQAFKKSISDWDKILVGTGEKEFVFKFSQVLARLLVREPLRRNMLRFQTHWATL